MARMVSSTGVVDSAAPAVEGFDESMAVVEIFAAGPDGPEMPDIAAKGKME